MCLENNNGEVDTTVPPNQTAVTIAFSSKDSTVSKTKKRKNPTKSCTFSECSNQFGEIMNVVCDNAAKSAKDSVLQDL